MPGLITPWKSEYEDYLRDESRLVGSAESISFPASEAEVIEVVKTVSARRGTITTQGARTGIVAGAVPNNGHVLNLSRMKAIGPIREENGEYRIAVQPGALLTEVQDALKPRKLFFPPDPTETSASIGGMVAANASGAMTFHYGPTRDWVTALRIVLADSDMLSIKRGESHAEGRAFSLTTEGDRVISGSLPTYTQPDLKSAAGYFVTDDMDIIDLFIGMEGTLGVITEIELRLIPAPGAVNGLMLFLPSEELALKAVHAMRGEPVDSFKPLPGRPVAIEFFNNDALEMLRRAKSDNPAFEKIPALKPHFHSAVYTEFHGESDAELEEPVMALMESLMEHGVSDDDTWFATTERELEPLKALRHAIPEAVNLLIDERKRDCQELTKLGTDMSVPDACLESVMAMYEAGLRENDLQSVIFGHIGNNHVHVNILPRDMGEYARGKELYMTWAREIVALGGSVSAEHGIGKIKAPFLELMYGECGVAEMRSLKALFDPNAMLNPGNLFQR